MKELCIGSNEAGQRLDKFLGKYMDKAPKSFLYKMLRKKNITLNGKKASGNEMLSAGDIANHNMQSIDNPLVESLPLFNLLGALEGQLIQDGGDDTISGEVVIALQADCPSIHPGCIVVCDGAPVSRRPA